jgi:hypothetical protein
MKLAMVISQTNPELVFNAHNEEPVRVEISQACRIAERQSMDRKIHEIL